MSKTHANTKYFCAKPFQWMELSFDHEFYLCCPTWLARPAGSGPSPRAAWNSEAAQEIRASILDGSFAYCKGCPFLSEKSGPVLPIDQVEDEDLKDIIYNKTTLLKRGPLWLNFSHDSSCNLACPSCRRKITYTKEKDLERNKQIMDRTLRELKSGLQWLYLAGSGDPFGSPLFYKVLKEMDQKEYPGLKLQLHSNGQLFDARRWESISRINRRVKHVHISIDAASAETYALNRKSNWRRLLKNLEFISNLRRTGAIEFFEVSMVVQQNNWREMIDFIKLARRFKVDRVSFNAILNWGTFPVREYKKRAVHYSSHPEYRQLTDFLSNDASRYAASLRDIQVRWGPFAQYLEPQSLQKQAEHKRAA